MKTYQIELTEKEIRRFKHQLNNAAGLIGGNDGTTNALREFAEKLEKAIADDKGNESFYAIGISNSLYWVGPDAATYSDSFKDVKKFPDKESAFKAIVDNGIKGAPVLVTIPKTE